MPKLEQQLDVPSLHHPPLPTPHVLPQMIHQICKKTVSLSELVVIQLNCAYYRVRARRTGGAPRATLAAGRVLASAEG